MATVARLGHSRWRRTASRRNATNSPNASTRPSSAAISGTAARPAKIVATRASAALSGHATGSGRRRASSKRSTTSNAPAIASQTGRKAGPGVVSAQKLRPRVSKAIAADSASMSNAGTTSLFLTFRLLLGQPDVLHQRAELRFLALEIFASLGQSIEVAALELLFQPVLPGLGGDCLAELVLPPGGDRRVGSRRRGYAPELAEHDVIAELLGGRHVLVRGLRPALLRQDRERKCLLLLEHRQAFFKGGKRGFDIPAQERGERLRAALVWDVREAHPGSLLDQGSGEMVGAARGRAGDAQLLRLLFGRLDEILERAVGRIRLHHEHQLRLNETGDRHHLADHRRRALHDRRGEHWRSKREQQILV